MPRMDEPDESASLAKVLIIADGKAGKSHWSGMAAAAGFNALYFDGDVARPTLKGLPLEARQRIYALDCADTMLGGVKDHKFLDTMIEFCTSREFKWNDTRQMVSSKKGDQPGDRIWGIKPARMDHTCVMVLDAWTGLSESMLTAAANASGVDLKDASTPQMRPVYQGAGIKSMQILQCIRSLRCHVIVIAHPDEFAHTIKPSGQKVGAIKETDLIIDWTKMIPKSTSKPNGLQMAKYFTDVLWLTTNASGSERLIDARINEGRMSGGHWNERKNADKEYSFANLVRHLGGTVPSETPPVDHWFTESLVGEAQASAPAPTLDGTAKTSAIQGGGMSSLFKKA